MESLFKDLATKWVGTINSIIVEKAEEREYLWRGLRAEYSADMSFSTISRQVQNVTADVVSMDSDLPLKSRAKMDSFEGEIPKLGMKKYLTEKQLKDIQVLQATNKPEYTIVQKIFDDYQACVTGPFETIEYQLYKQLADGVYAVDASTNTGTEVRLDIGIDNSHRFGGQGKWSSANAAPIADIERILAKADEDGVVLSLMLMDRKTFNYFRNSTEVKEYYATYRDLRGDRLATPNLEKVNEMMLAEFNLTIRIMERNFKFEKNGTITNVKGWTEGQVSFVPSMTDIGTLFWSDLAEANARVEYKTYAFPEPWLMVSQYREGSPLREWTESQGIVAPVLTMGDQMYLLDTTEALELAAADEGLESDANITLWDTVLVKQDVIDELNNMGITTSNTIQDSSLITKVNKLSDEDEATLKAALGVS